MNTKTIIHSNGSRWAGEKDASIEELFAILAEYPLRRDLEACGDFIVEGPICVWQNGYDEETGYPLYIESDEQPYAGMTSFWGNFYNLSHVFNISSNDPAVIATLTAAIRANQARPDYLAQPKPEPIYSVTIRKDGRREVN